MPSPRLRPDLAGRVFRGSTEVRAGRVTRNELRGPSWTRLLPDVYADASLQVTHLLRARAVVEFVAPAAVLSGTSAAAVWGLGDLAGPTDPVEVTLPPGVARPDSAAVRVRRRTLPAGSSTRRDGLPVTTAEVTALDLAAGLPLVDAVVLLDRFLELRVTRLDWLREAAGLMRGPGCRRGREAAALADGLAGSPQETRLRLLIHASDLPRPVAQYEVRVGGRFVARADFAWPEKKVALEYEGAWHTRQVAADRRRIEALQAAGWRVLFVTAADLHHPAALLARIATALAR